jgi:cell division protein FtsQ
VSKILQIGTWIALALMFIVLWGFTASEQNNKVCEKLEVVINQENGNLFLSIQDIEISLREENLHPVGKKIGDIDLNEIETKLDMIAEVKKASVHKNLNGVVSIHIEQRTPIVRIMNANGTQFYLDEDGYQMPLSENYAPRVPVVTGHINDPGTQYSVTEIMKNPTLAETVKSDEVYTLVKYISKNEFWKAQIQQINFNQYNDIELMPTLGSHLIIFGDLENMEPKFNKLKIFYKEGLNHLDWNAYDTINVKFRNQIICTKK